MKVVIIEDEKPAAEKLLRDLRQVRSDIQVIRTIHDVRSAVSWFRLKVPIDLIFMDIELSDGLSFEILKAVKISVPIIFITAYDHYWQQALTLNGIDYLQKPVEIIDLKKALSKYDLISRHFNEKIESLLKYVAGNNKTTYKEKFLVRRGKELVMVKSADIAYFKSSHKVTMIITSDAKKLIIEESLVQLEDELDPEVFFRVNRQFIVNIRFIERITIQPKGRLKVKMPNSSEEIFVPQEKTSSFKQLLER